MATRVVIPTTAAIGGLAMFAKLGVRVRRFEKTGGGRFCGGRTRGAVLLASCVVLLAAPASATASVEPALHVIAPKVVGGGVHPAGAASFGPPLIPNGIPFATIWIGADEANAEGPSITDACTPLINGPGGVAGNIALVDRGTCSFTVKVKNAQDAGAVGVVVADNVAGAPVSGMGGTDPTITIPSVKITQEVGALLRTRGINPLVPGSIGLFDATPPVLSLPSEVVANATGPDGANVFFEVSATDDDPANPTVFCERPDRSPARSGDLFPIGSTAVTCGAWDATFNSSEGVFQIHVKGAPEQISDVAADIRALNLKQGIANSLDAKLQNLLAALADVRDGARASACNKLDAAVNEINAQAGKAITDAQAAALLTRLARIRAVLAC